MKRFFAILLAIAMVMTCAIALADNPTIAGDGAEGEVRFNVSGSPSLPSVYKIQVEWDITDGSYTFGTGDVGWDEDKMDYIYPSGSSSVTAPEVSFLVTNLSTPGIAYDIDVSYGTNNGGWIIGDFYGFSASSGNTTDKYVLAALDIVDIGGGSAVRQTVEETYEYALNLGPDFSTIDEKMLYALAQSDGSINLMTDTFTLEFSLPANP